MVVVSIETGCAGYTRTTIPIVFYEVGPSHVMIRQSTNAKILAIVEASPRCIAKDANASHRQGQTPLNGRPRFGSTDVPTRTTRWSRKAA